VYLCMAALSCCHRRLACRQVCFYCSCCGSERNLRRLQLLGIPLQLLRLLLHIHDDDAYIQDRIHLEMRAEALCSFLDMCGSIGSASK
jgi:hypothetical protein